MPGGVDFRYFQIDLKEKDDREFAELEVLDLVGAMIEFWGFRKILGQLWAALYLAGRPMSAPELQRRLKASSGAVSLALGDLKKWGAISQTWRPGYRGILYVPETNFWKMVSRVVRERELNLVSSAAERLHACEEMLLRLSRSARGAEKRELIEIAGRVEKLHRLSVFALNVLRALVSLRAIEPATVLKFANLAVGSGSPLEMWRRR